MISLENVTTTSTSSSPIVSQEETSSSTLSFSELLRGIGTTKETPTAQNGVVVLALDSEQENQASKPDTLLSLLKTTDSLDGEEDLLLDSSSPEDVNLDKLSSSELKALMKDAKNYLKDQIIASDGFKKSEADSLPKTLKGLAQVADKYGIDVSKITLDEIQVDSKTATQTSLELKKGFQNTKETSITTETTSISEEEIVDLDSKLQDKSKTDVKSSALFKAQGSKEITTEQFVQTRLSSSNPAESKTSKQKADDTLQMLLRGEKSTKSDSGLTVDFSVATARVIAPQATTETRSSLESLLSGEEKESSSSTASTASKTDSFTVSKADSFEVKLNEAKQMTKYLSADVKTAIEDYKSPFTRVKVQLNPQNLGEVDLTIVQRGKNLHINLSSNNAAINTLALNANDLKAQLSNNGINNATLNFNNNSQSSDPSFSGGQQQQQNPQQGRDASREYNYFENEEQNEEMLSSLEIVVPHYA